MASLTSRGSLAIFGRAATPGRTKTRLIPALGSAGAAHLYRGFVRDVLAHASAVAELQVQFWSAGDPGDPDLAFLPDALPRRAQCEGDLGSRMWHALEAGLAQHAVALVAGSDAPSLAPSYLRAALRALTAVGGPDVVLGPAADGGYYLVGVRRLRPGLFDRVRLSTRHALADTCAAARALGMRVDLLPPWYDVDDAEDLILLRTELALHPAAAPHTRQALVELDGRGA